MRISLISFIGFYFLMASQTNACITRVPTDFATIKYADVVVVGNIVNYRVVPSDWATRHHGTSSNLWSDRFDERDRPAGKMTDYAIFDIRVDRVLKGSAPRHLTVTWNASTFPEPAKMQPGKYLIALRDPTSKTLPSRAPSATVFANPDSEFLTVMNPPCAGALMYSATTNIIQHTRRVLNEQKR